MSEPALIHALFEKAARRTPEALALIAGTRQATFAELDRGAELIAAAVRAACNAAADAPLPAGTMIGLALGRSIEATAGMLGILKAGGAWVPLDPAYPELRLRFMLQDTAAPVVLTTRPLFDKLAFLGETSATVLCIDEITRFRLNNDLLRLKHELATTVVFVTHSVFESVYLSTRIAVFSARPGRIVETIEVDEPLPRSEDFRLTQPYAQACRRASDALHAAMEGH